MTYVGLGRDMAWICLSLGTSCIVLLSFFFFFFFNRLGTPFYLSTVDEIIINRSTDL